MVALWCSPRRTTDQRRERERDEGAHESRRHIHAVQWHAWKEWQSNGDAKRQLGGSHESSRYSNREQER